VPSILDQSWDFIIFRISDVEIRNLYKGAAPGARRWSKLWLMILGTYWLVGLLFSVGVVGTAIHEEWKSASFIESQANIMHGILRTELQVGRAKHHLPGDKLTWIALRRLYSFECNQYWDLYFGIYESSINGVDLRSSKLGKNFRR
jgi:hypothetical protein